MADIRDYTQHKPECHSRSAIEPRSCSCGLDEALKEVENFGIAMEMEYNKALRRAEELEQKLKLAHEEQDVMLAQLKKDQAALASDQGSESVTKTLSKDSST